MTSEQNISFKAANPLISVIITCFNQEQWIDSALSSVVSQNWKELECIVVDDGSTDKSADLVRSWEQKDARVRLVQQTNQGVSKARNTGFRHSKGNFIQFLDGDDLLNPEKLLLHMQHFTEHPEMDVSWCEHEYLDEATGKRSHYPQGALNQHPLDQMLENWFDGVSLPIHAALFRRRLWQQGEVPFSESYRGRCEDWIFLVSVALKQAKFLGIQEILCVYRIGASGFTSSNVAWNAAAIRASIEIAEMLPLEKRETFLDLTFRKTLHRFARLEQPRILHESWNWRIGYFLTRPFYLIFRSIKRLMN